MQEEIKRQVNKKEREVEVWRKGDRVMLSTKDLVFKEWPTRNYYVGLYIIEEVVSANTVELKLLTTIRVYLAVNVS